MKKTVILIFFRKLLIGRMSSFNKNSNLSVIAMLDTAIFPTDYQPSSFQKHRRGKHGNDSKFTKLEVWANKNIVINRLKDKLSSLDNITEDSELWEYGASCYGNPSSILGCCEEDDYGDESWA